MHYPVSLPTSSDPTEAPADTTKSKKATRKSRYSVSKTTAETEKDLDKKTADMETPDNLETTVTYDEKDNSYTIGTTLSGNAAAGGQKKAKPAPSPASGKKGGTSSYPGTGIPGVAGFSVATATSYLNTPILMTPEEYQEWSLKQSMQRYYRQKNAEAFETEGKNKFDFTDMHFDLGPAEKIFGPGGVQIKTQGSAELKMGGTMKNVDNPALAASRRKTFGFNFVLCEVQPPFTANGLALTLLKNHNILVSACSAKKGIAPNRYIRLAVRSTEDNNRLAEALTLICKQ